MVHSSYFSENQQSLNSGFNYLKGNCPVCSGLRKDCRQGKETNLVHCRAEISFPPPGWEFIKTDRQGFNVYAEADKSDTNSQDWEKVKAERLLRSQQLKRARLERLKKALPIDQRDRQHRLMAQALGLSTPERENLKGKRGLPDEQINHARSQDLIWSWKGGKLRGISANLPGAAGANRLKKLTGLAVGIPDCDGAIAGCQVRTDESWRWFANPQLPNGELPIGVYQPIGEPIGENLWLMEGYLKTLIGALRLQEICVGMAGANFTSAPEQLNQILERFPDLPLVLAADGGAVSNKTVMAAYKRLHDFVVAAGRPLQIAWWGQLTKEDGDIDEIGDLSRIRLIRWEEFAAISIEHGGLKEPKQSEPSHEIAEDRADRERWELEAEQSKQELGREIKRIYNRATYRYWKKFGELPASPKLNPKTDPKNQPYKYAKDGAIALYDPAFARRRWVIEVTPETVPTVQDWELAGCPRFVFDSEFSVDILWEMVDLGYLTILFDAIVGAGKSHIAGALLARWRQFQAGQEDPELAYYLANNYRNPPTPTLEDLPETITGGALIVDYGKLTPGGKPYRRRPTKAQQSNPDIKATCIEDATIQKARSRGIDIQRGYKSEFCRNGCWMGAKCEYLRLKKQQELEPVLRSHPTNALRAGRFAIVDEAGQAITTTRSTSIKLEDLDTERGRLARLNGYLSAISESVLEALTQGITRAIEERDTRHGLTDAEVRQFLPSAEQLLELSISETWLQSSDVWGETTSLEKLALRIQQVTQPDIEEVFQLASTPEDKQRRIDDLFTTSGYANLLIAIAGNKHDIRITPKGKIIITKRDRRVAQNLAKFDTVILMDATPDPSHLARQLGRPAKSFARVSTYKPRFDNGAITSIVGFGQARNQRGSSEEKYIDSQYSVENRAVRLVEALCDRHSGESIGLIDYKNWLPKYDFLKDRHNIVMGAEYVDSRGSNLFKNCDVLILVAKPVENLGALLTEWNLLTGESRTIKSAPKRFWSWVNRRSLHELIQGVGRTRLQYRNRPIQIYLVSEISEFDARAIASYFPGIQIKQESVFSICSTAATKGEQSKYKIISSIWEQIKNYGVARAAQTAADSGISKGRVSQVVSELNTGFKALTKSLDLLYKASYRETKLSDLDLSPETLFLAQTYLPEVAAALERQEITQQEALQEFINLAESCGADTFRKVVALTPIDAIATIFNRAIAYLLSFDIGPIPWEIPPPNLQQMEVAV